MRVLVVIKCSSSNVVHFMSRSLHKSHALVLSIGLNGAGEKLGRSHSHCMWLKKLSLGREGGGRVGRKAGCVFPHYRGEKMGVGKGFWDQLKPLARAEDLSFLRGKKLAIDLSYWLVQQQTALKDIRVRKPHLRLTFYRVVILVAKIGALPVFVVDGEPPTLKQVVRLKRINRVANISPGPMSQSPTSSESNTPENGPFSKLVEECVETAWKVILDHPCRITETNHFHFTKLFDLPVLLELLGMPVLRAKGEAESLCARLDSEGLVDACVTADSDALVHGAKCVIKTLQLDTKNKDPAVELYRLEDIEAAMGLSQNHLLALALLIGCDYQPEGVAGVGLTHALRLIRCYPGSEILNRLRAWGRGERPSRADLEQYLDVDSTYVTDEETDGKLSKIHCSRCGHPGSKTVHTKSGCQQCSTSCEDTSLKTGCNQKAKDFRCSCQNCLKKARNKVRAKSEGWWTFICNKMASTPGFPDERIIDIFLGSDSATAEDVMVHASNITWHGPRMEALEIFLKSQLDWDAFYVRQKTLPLLSHLYLSQLATLANCSLEWSSGRLLLSDAYAPHSILRMKIEQGEPLYMLQWRSVKKGIDGEEWLGLTLKPTPLSIAKKQTTATASGKGGIDDDPPESGPCFITNENLDLVRVTCPQLVEEFENEQEAKRRGHDTKRKKIEGTECPGKQSTITAFFQAKHVLHASKTCKKSDIQFSPRTPALAVSTAGDMTTEALISTLNSTSSSTKFSSISPPQLRDPPRRRISRSVVRKLSL